jgi:dihydrofolate synthase/folylpolyglutamate synthase
MTGSDRVLERLTTLHPKVIDLTLGRVERLLAALGHPERRLPPVIHVAGTNGKGSVVAMLRAGLEASGHRIHVYTSPHLARFHERIRIAGTLIDEDRLIALLERCEAANADAPITFFEITTAAAFLAMAETPADFTLLEVGLGGRLDATNVIERPRLCAITPVSIDHQQYLGETLAEIAGEKAGILKRGVPCVVGVQEPAALAAIEGRATRVEAPLLIANHDWQVWEEHGRMAFLDPAGLLDLPLPALIGAHQVANAGIALAALRALGADEAACAAAVSRAEWPARLQRLRRGPLVAAAGAAELWLDGGHNPAAGIALAEALTRLPPRPLHLVTGMLRTKDAAGFLRPLAPLARSLRAVTIPGEAATLTAEETVAAAGAAGFADAAPAANAADAVAALAAAEPSARILICGSLYLAGQVLRDNG